MLLAVVLPVPGLLPDALVEDLRPAHLHVAVVAVHAAHVLLDLLPQRPALGMPEHHAGRFVLHVEEVQLRAQAPVVALLGLLQHLQVRVLVLLLRPGRAVDALEHFVLRVAAPVGAGDAHQLEDLELAGRGHVRPAAQVDPVALAVERNRVLLGDRGDDLRLVDLALVAEEFHRLVARHLAPVHGQVAPGDLGHALFDRREILGRERALVGKVVVEAVFDHRPDGHLRLGVELLHRLREQVRRGVADRCPGPPGRGR